MFNVSFGRRVPFVPTKPINKARASELAQAINSAFNTCGIPHAKPSRAVSGESLKRINYDCFDKATDTLNEKGIKGFNKINKDIGVTTSDNLAKYVAGMREYIQQYSYEGKLSRLFDQIKY